MAKYSIKNINNIRILPMHNKEEETIEFVQEDFFENKLPNERNYWYEYFISGLNSKENDLILFRFENKIIASALFDMATSYPKGYANEKGFNGAIILKKGSIKTFQPIEITDLKKHMDIGTVGQTKYNIKKSDVKELEQLLDRMEVPRK